VTKDETGNQLSILDALFVPYFRSKFLALAGTRFSAYGICSQGELARETSGSSENAVRELLGNVARAVNSNLQCQEIAIAVFNESDLGSYIIGCDPAEEGEVRSSLVGDLEQVLSGGYAPAFGTCTTIQRKAGEVVDEESGGILVLPLYVDDKIGGVVAALRGSGEEFSAGDQARLRLVAVILGCCAQEIAAEGRGEERLRSLAYGLSAALDARDPKTRGHSHRVAMYAMAIVNEMISDNDEPEYRGLRNRIRIGALLHDIGKVGIPDMILIKEDKLTDEEYEYIKQHSVLGAEIVTACHGLRDLVPGVLYHHEHYDGSGYPFGLSGEDIPLMARVISLADAFDAITSNRPFREASSHEEGIEIVQGKTAKNFDPVVLKALVSAYHRGALSHVRVPPKSNHFERDSDASVEKVYGRQLKSLPTLPHILSKVNSLLSDPDASLREVAKVLSTDEGMASRVLRLVNSAYYGLPRMVSTIPLATTILGTRAIKNHVVNIAYADLMSSLGGSHRSYDLLWTHALKTATWARYICEGLGGVDPEEAFTAGLVHDLGKALSLRLKPEDYGRLVVQAEKSGRPLIGVEQEIVGFDHTRMGAWAAGRWMLPQSLVAAIRWHHDPEWLGDECDEIYDLVRVIHVADIAARACDMAIPGFTAFLLEELSPQVLKELGSAYFIDLESVREEVQEAQAELAETFEARRQAVG
jgi:putative nucleotidyltransferase with HDIG domain